MMHLNLFGLYDSCLFPSGISSLRAKQFFTFYVEHMSAKFYSSWHLCHSVVEHPKFLKQWSKPKLCRYVRFNRSIWVSSRYGYQVPKQADIRSRQYHIRIVPCRYYIPNYYDQDPIVQFSSLHLLWFTLTLEELCSLLLQCGTYVSFTALPLFV